MIYNLVIKDVKGEEKGFIREMRQKGIYACMVAEYPGKFGQHIFVDCMSDKVHDPQIDEIYDRFGGERIEQNARTVFNISYSMHVEGVKYGPRPGFDEQVLFEDDYQEGLENNRPVERWFISGYDEMHKKESELMKRKLAILEGGNDKN